MPIEEDLHPTLPSCAGRCNALHQAGVVRGVSAWPSDRSAALALDGDRTTAWTGLSGASRWEWRVAFPRPLHLGLLRAHFGDSATLGVPTTFRWEARVPLADGTCDDRPSHDNARLLAIPGADQTASPMPAEATRRSWFVDIEACGLRLLVDRSLGGPPTLREVEAFESAVNVLNDARVDDAGTGSNVTAAHDAAYATRWTGKPGLGQWTLTARFATALAIDRVRLVLGTDAVSRPRGRHGRNYAVAGFPVRYVLEGSSDGVHFAPLTSTPLRDDGSVLLLRRRLVRTDGAPLLALRLVMTGATGATGEPEASASPVVRELAAYRSDDPRAVLAAPWILSVNANPTAQMHRTRGGELANDIYFAKFLQQRLSDLLPALRRDDRYARSLGPRGELIDVVSSDAAGEALEAIEGDDVLLDAAFLERSSPPPVVVLSGSNDWDYGRETKQDDRVATHWSWNPLAESSKGGMRQFSRAVKARVAPMLGVCGGAQILALLEARPERPTSADEDQAVLDAILRRTTGEPIRGFPSSFTVKRVWPGERQRPSEVQFDPDSRLFGDLAGPARRSRSHAFPMSHTDVVRPDVFDGPLRRMQLVATGQFCGPRVVSAGPYDLAEPNLFGAGRCVVVPEAYRSRDGRYPLTGVQFHPEQRDFEEPLLGDPPESVADPRLLLAAVWEEAVDAYLRNAP